MMKRTVCKYEPKCYRTNSDHLKAFSHPSRDAAAAAARATSPKATKPPGSPVRAPVTPATASPARGRTPPPLSSPRSPSAAKRFRGEDSTLPALPKPRASPLKGPPEDVFEMPFPKEVQEIYAVAKRLRPEAPLWAFSGVILVGPFSLLDGKEFRDDAAKWRHWRFRYDPPELQTVMVSQELGPAEGGASPLPRFHWCYHRDDPKQLPGMVVRGTATGRSFDIQGSCLASVLYGLKAYPELKSLCPVGLSPAADQEKAIKARKRLSLASTIHRLGISVPYDKRTEVGYREPMFHHGKLSTLLKQINTKGALSHKQEDELDEQLRFADIANDESDFGLNIELGLNFFACVERANTVAQETFRILDTAYMLLNRGLYQHILAVHMPLLAKGVPPPHPGFVKASVSASPERKTETEKAEKKTTLLIDVDADTEVEEDVPPKRKSSRK